MSNLTFDAERARSILGRMYAAYQLRQGLYEVRHANKGDAPQDRFIPKGVERGSRDHAIFLYFATGTDRRQVSNTLYRAHMHLWERRPRMYQSDVLLFKDGVIKRNIFSCPIGMKDEIAKNWKPCARTLYREFEGDPTALYASGSIDQILKYKQSAKQDPLPGFGPKIFSLLAIFYEDLGLLSGIQGAFPVDVHIQRICISTGIVSGNGTLYREGVAEFIRPRLYELCMEEGWNRSDLAHAMWFNGSELCNGCATSRVVASLCTVYELCDGGLPTRQYGKEGRWNFDQPRREKGSPNHVLFVPQWDAAS